MNLKINNIFLFLMIMLCYGCVNIDTNEKKEIYVVYDNSWSFNVISPKQFDVVIPRGCELIINYCPNNKQSSINVYRRSFNRRYWFIGKFLIDKDKNISFVPVTFSKKFDEKKYQKQEIEDIKTICSITSANLTPNQATSSYSRSAFYDIYYDIEKKIFIRLSKNHPKYIDYFLFSLGSETPQYLVIKNDYGKQLMENGIILPDPNELKDNIVWQDWYNYWGLTDYKIEIP